MGVGVLILFLTDFELFFFDGGCSGYVSPELMDKVMGEHRKAFPEIFEKANDQLRSVRAILKKNSHPIVSNCLQQF